MKIISKAITSNVASATMTVRLSLKDNFLLICLGCLAIFGANIRKYFEYYVTYSEKFHETCIIYNLFSYICTR